MESIFDDFWSPEQGKPNNTEQPTEEPSSLKKKEETNSFLQALEGGASIFDNFDSDAEVEPKTEEVNPKQERTKNLFGWEDDLLEEGETWETVNNQRYKEIYQNKLGQEVVTGIEEQFKKLPKNLINLNHYVLNGGKLEDFINNISEQNKKVDLNLDLTNAENQELVVRNALSIEGRDADYIEKNIKFLKKEDLLEQESLMRYEKGKLARKEEEKKLVEQQKQIAQVEKDRLNVLQQERLDFRRSINEYLNAENKDLGFTFSEEDKKATADFYLTPTFTSEDGQNVTDFQKSLKDIFNSPAKAALLRKIIQSDFDFSFLSKKLATKATQKVREQLNNKAVDDNSDPLFEFLSTVV